ncbi:MAG: hypothetical protein NTV51_14360 [Verrucomicrobia bacterium]|nr:hypothetical protein [Verrucomicrobiota bacterium]
MKSLKALVVAGLALASSLVATAGTPAQAWLENYYQNPRPAELSRSIHSLSHSGWFEQEGNVATGIGFLATVFAQNPERVTGWLSDLSDLPLEHRRLVAASLWQAGNPYGAELLKGLAGKSAVRGEVVALASKPVRSVATTPVLSPSSMNLQWGAFLASGNDRHVVAILEAMGTDRPGLDLAARQSLAQNVAAHPRVLEICRIQLDRQPESVRSEVRAALNAAAAKPGA